MAKILPFPEKRSAEQVLRGWHLIYSGTWKKKYEDVLAQYRWQEWLEKNAAERQTR